MEISTSKIVNTPGSAEQTATNSTGATGGVLSSDFETFLKMLTAQARYQDPLEPLDSSEYAAQLAQFSMVEQQVLSNDLLKSLTNQLGAGNLAQMAGWIGMEARTTEAKHFNGSTITVHTKVAPNAEQAFLVVYDEQGQTVQRVELPKTASAVEWAGVSDDGLPFTAGLYRFEVEAISGGELISTTKAETYSRVIEARADSPAGPQLVIEGGTTVAASDVLAVREPISGAG